MITLPMSCHVLLHVQFTRHVHEGKPANLIIHGMPGFTYGHAIHAGQMIFIQNNHLTYLHPKYENRKPERAEKDSHCHAQREQGRYK